MIQIYFGVLAAAAMMLVGGYIFVTLNKKYPKSIGLLLGLSADHELQYQQRDSGLRYQRGEFYFGGVYARRRENPVHAVFQHQYQDLSVHLDHGCKRKKQAADIRPPDPDLGNYRPPL